MPEVRIFNPGNPRKKTPWTYDQAAARKHQAESFTREVLEDDERADEIASMTPEEYAAERGKKINGDTMRKKVGTEQQARDNPVAVALDAQKKLYEEIQELKDELRDRDQILDAIVDVLEDADPAFTPEDRLEQIDTIISGKDEDGAGE